MLTVKLSASLAAYLPNQRTGGAPGAAAIALAGEDWPTAVDEIRGRFPRLADRVFDPAGGLRSGFLLAVDDEVCVGADYPPDVAPDSEIFLFVQIAGGSR